MSTITARDGDTFDSLSRRAFGTENKAQAFRRANPAISEPIAEGATLTVPVIPGAPRDKASTIEGDGIGVIVNGQQFSAWTGVSLTLAIDKPPALTIASPWLPESDEMRAVFRPFSFQPVAVNIGQDAIFTGVMLTPAPASTPDGHVISVSAYGQTGTAYDCAAPASSYPLEFDNLTLDVIAGQLLAPFGIAPQFDAAAGAPFERVSMQPAEPVMAFLATLAKQRNLVIGETAEGAALFQQSASAGAPVAILEDAKPPVISVAPSFNAQSVFSDITAIAPTTPGVEGEQFTAKNARLTGTVRPHTFTATDTTPDGLQTSAEAKLGRMYANAVSWAVTVPAWRGPSGDVWRPNTTIKLTAPNAMIYNKTEFLIKEVALQADENGRSATLQIVLPGAYSGQAPETLPWD